MDILSVMASKFKVRPVFYADPNEARKSSMSIYEELGEVETENVDLTKTCASNQNLSRKNICTFYSRPWSPKKSIYNNLYVDNILKWSSHLKKNRKKWLKCRKLSMKKKRKICTPKEKIIIEPCVYEVEKDDQCVFCFESLYKKGHICDLYKKIPLIKKQSELNQDHVAMTIGEKNRIVVHKKCYDAYADPLSRQWEVGGEKSAEIIKKITMSDVLLAPTRGMEEEDTNCGQEEEIKVEKICGK